jgi:hypothetical protein
MQQSRRRHTCSAESSDRQDGDAGRIGNASGNDQVHIAAELPEIHDAWVKSSHLTHALGREIC